MKRILGSILAALSLQAVAASDPDSIGRTVRYLDYGIARPISVAALGITCDSTSLRCYTTNAEGRGNVSVTDALVLDVAPSFTRSLLCMTTQNDVLYTFRHFGMGAPRTKSAFQLHRQIRIESSALNDPSLINRQTGLPFNGAIESQTTLLLDEANLENAETEQHIQTLTTDCTKGTLSRSMLVNDYGLSYYMADRVVRGSLKITIRINFMHRGMNASYLEFGARLYSD